MPLTLPMPNHMVFRAEPATCAKTADVVADKKMAAQQEAIAISSSEILRGQKTVEISHNGLIYRLQATRLGKLILTK
jgi:hemin uptake protein HemP